MVVVKVVVVKVVVVVRVRVELDVKCGVVAVVMVDALVGSRSRRATHT